jgi:hypothetical protein
MPTLTHILAATLCLAAVLIHAAWRRWHQAPPTCGVCGRYNCRGGCDDLAVWKRCARGDR